MGSIIMPKENIDKIIKAVERYKRGETSQNAEAKKQGVHHRTFQDWIRRYETFGAEGFKNTGNRKYSSDERTFEDADQFTGSLDAEY